MEQTKRDKYPVHMTFSEVLPKPFIDSNAGTVYYGYAYLGAAEDEPKWKIERHVTVGNITKVTYPNSSMAFDFKWSERASLSYSR
jgi:hypothetical protein